VATALREFRYARRLVSADEARDWLASWELSAAEWKTAVTHRLLRARGLPLPGAEVTWADLVCSGHLETLAQRLAEHAAVANGGVAPAAAEDASVAPVPMLPSWLGLRQTHDPPAVRHLMEIRRTADTRRQRDISAERIRQAIAARGLDWTHVDLVRLILPSETAAAEAAFRVREDGDTLSSVALELGQPLEPWSGFLEAAPERDRMTLAAARPGEMVGPLSSPGGYALLQVLSRRAPCEADPAVWDHARTRLWAEVMERAMANVRWEAPCGPVRRE
jgi:hypothetical protein